MNKYQQLKYAQFFDEIVDTQIRIQKLKSYFSHSDLPKVFYYMLRTQKQLSIKKIIQILGSQFTSQQAFCVISKMDANRLNKVCIEDFCAALLPKQTNQLSKSNKNNIQSCYLKVIEIFKAIIEQQKILDMCRLELQNIRLYEAFDTIDKHRLGYLTHNNFSNFMLQNQIPLNDKQIHALMSFFRKDKNSKINLEAFCEALKLSKTKYQQYYKIEQRKQQQGKWLANYQKQTTQLRFQAEKRRNKLIQKHKQERRNKLKKMKYSQNTSQNSLRQNQFRQKQKEALLQEKIIRSGSSCQHYILKQLQDQIQAHKQKVAQLQQINNFEYDKNYLLSRTLQADNSQLEQCKQRAKWTQSLLENQMNNIEEIQIQKLYREGLNLKNLRQQMVQQHNKTDIFQEKQKQKIFDDQERRRRKQQLQNELEKMRIEIQIRKKRNEIDHTAKNQIQKIKKLRYKN